VVKTAPRQSTCDDFHTPCFRRVTTSRQGPLQPQLPSPVLPEQAPSLMYRRTICTLPCPICFMMAPLVPDDKC